MDLVVDISWTRIYEGHNRHNQHDWQQYEKVMVDLWYEFERTSL